MIKFPGSDGHEGSLGVLGLRRVYWELTCGDFFSFARRGLSPLHNSVPGFIHSLLALLIVAPEDIAFRPRGCCVLDGFSSVLFDWRAVLGLGRLTIAIH